MAIDPAKPVGLDLLHDRPATYGGYARELLLDRLPQPLHRVLDVGCAEGGGASALRARGATVLTGIEVDDHFARVAQRRYDEVLIGSIEDALPWPPHSFDTVLCYDVLEHLYDPWTVVRLLHDLVHPDGHLHVSIPNSRNIAFWRPLVMQGSMSYGPSGLRDVTHIRFFSRSDAIAMLEAGGFRLVSVAHTGGESRKRRLARAVTREWATEFFAFQWVLLASPA